MAPVGPLKFRRLPEPVRRQMDVAAATAWEALVEAHTAHALRFIALMAAALPFDDAVDRYLDEMDVDEAMAASVRARVLIAVRESGVATDARPTLRDVYGEAADEAEGLKRFRPDVLMKGIARRVRAGAEEDERVSLAMARAEEGMIRAHVENAALFAALLRPHAGLDEAVEDYIELMRLSGGRAQAVFQRTMARLADDYLPDPKGPKEGGGDAARSGGAGDAGGG